MHKAKKKKNQNQCRVVARENAHEIMRKVFAVKYILQKMRRLWRFHLCMKSKGRKLFQICNDLNSIECEPVVII